MHTNLSIVIKTIIVYNKCILFSPLTFSAFKNGISISFSKILNPKFFETGNLVYYCDLNVKVIEKVTMALQAKDFNLTDLKLIN